MGFEPMNTGFADQRVSHFAIGAHRCQPEGQARTRFSLFLFWGRGLKRVNQNACLHLTYFLLLCGG